MAQLIKHRGIVEHITADHIQVRIVQTSACSACSIKGHCNASESKEKLVDVFTTSKQSAMYSIGQEVMVCGSTQMCITAVCYAFVVPFVLLLFVLFLCIEAFLLSELVACLAVLVLLSIYYIGLYLMRDKLSKKFTFTIESINN